ncbi:MAG: hypothetical protein ABJB40_13685 [Acidobacteriota bacterium]
MIRLFQIAAVILALIAAYFLWTGDKDTVFIALVLSACCLLLSIRFQAKARLDQHAAEKGEDILRK